ncbi:MAG: protein kinase [Planctomycetes bacterium]|nr:protein kinase [Planctomycetota bacterium]
MSWPPGELLPGRSLVPSSTAPTALIPEVTPLSGSELESARRAGEPAPAETAPSSEPPKRADALRDALGPLPPRLGNYELVAELGRGGMGVVYKAYRPELRSYFAVKVMRGATDGDPEAARRFQREAQVSARLRHPGIVPVHDVGVEGGRHYLAMEYVEGVGLDRVVEDPSRAGLARPSGRRLGAKRRGLRARDAARIGKEVAEAIDYAHRHGVVHRDLKPGNVLIDRDGRARVVDFGLAKLLHGSAADGMTRTTEAGTAIGTLAYMPPEQASGEAGGIDARTDVYSLGAMLYELVTGRLPFVAPTPLELLGKILTQEPFRPRDANPELAADLETIVLRAMEKTKSARYQDAAELAADLGRFLDGDAILAARTGLLSTAVRGLRRHPSMSAAVLVSAGVIFLLTGEIVRARMSREDAERRAVEGANAGAEAALDEARRCVGELASARAAVERPLVHPQPGALRRARVHLEELDGRARRALVTAANLSQRALGVRPGDARAGKTYLETLLVHAQAEAALERFDGAAAYLRLLDRFDARRLLAGEAAEVARRVEGWGTLSLSTEPAGAEASIQGFLADSMTWTERRALGATPTARAGFRMGSYVVTLAKQGFATTRVPVRMARNDDRAIPLELCPATAVPDGMVYVPGGACRLGNAAAGEVVREVDGFLLDRRETSCGEYKVFLDAQPAQVRGVRAPLWEGPPGARIDWSVRGELPEAVRVLPVHGLSWEDADAYASWAGKRLPAGVEWEKAARGADGRAFPWGESFEEGRASCAGSPGPEPSGLYPVDALEAGASPYGCLHMAGNVAEYVDDRPSAGVRVLRGGSLQEPAAGLHASAVATRAPDSKALWAGVRCAKDP